MSEVYQSLSHSRWYCKYHVIFVPKRRRKVLYGALREQLKTIIRDVAQPDS
jgi:putative transposase